MFDRDRFASLPIPQVANAAMGLLDRAQAYTSEAQVAGAAVVFLAVAERHGIAPQDAFTVVKNVMAQGDGRRPEFRAIRQYMENET